MQKTANTALIVCPPEANRLPEMAKLSQNQRNYVFALCSTGGRETDAARLAGYAGTSESLKQAVMALKRNPKVLDAIKAMAQTEIKASAFLAAAALREIVEDPSHKDRLKAADILLNRSGLLVIQETKVTVEHKDQSTDAIIARIRALAKDMQMDPVPLLLGAGVPKTVIDAEFSVVDTTASTSTLPPEPEPAAEDFGAFEETWDQ